MKRIARVFHGRARTSCVDSNDTNRTIAAEHPGRHERHGTIDTYGLCRKRRGRMRRAFVCHGIVDNDWQRRRKLHAGDGRRCTVNRPLFPRDAYRLRRGSRCTFWVMSTALDADDGNSCSLLRRARQWRRDFLAFGYGIFDIPRHFRESTRLPPPMDRGNSRNAFAPCR